MFQNVPLDISKPYGDIVYVDSDRKPEYVRLICLVSSSARGTYAFWYGAHTSVS